MGETIHYRVLHFNNSQQISNQSNKVSAEYKCDHLFDSKVPTSTYPVRLLNTSRLAIALSNQ